MLSKCKKYAKNEIIIKPFLSIDGEGQAAYGDDIDLTCLISGKLTVVKNLQGDEVVSMKTLYIDAALISNISYKDVLIFEEEEHIPISILIVYNRARKDLFVVYC